MSFAGKEAFSKTFERRYAEVTVPVVGKVRIRNLNELERTQQLAWTRDKKGKPLQERVELMDLRYIIDCVVDEQGNRVFGIEDLPSLKEMDYGVKVKLLNEILKHCHLVDQNIDELAKNFDATAD